MFDTAGLKKTSPDLAFERRAFVGFDNVRISIDAEYFVHDLNNLFSSSTAYNLYNGKTRILVCNDHEVLTRRKRAQEGYAAMRLIHGSRGRFHMLRGSVCCLAELA